MFQLVKLYTNAILSSLVSTNQSGDS